MLQKRDLTSVLIYGLSMNFNEARLYFLGVDDQDANDKWSIGERRMDLGFQGLNPNPKICYQFISKTL